jgi:hypothetical protein
MIPKTNGSGVCQTFAFAVTADEEALVVLKIVILVEGVTEPLMCDGVTLVVNRHGALISAAAPLRNELKVKIQVVLTGMRAHAKVVHVDAERLQVCESL